MVSRAVTATLPIFVAAAYVLLGWSLYSHQSEATQNLAYGAAGVFLVALLLARSWRRTVNKRSNKGDAAN